MKTILNNKSQRFISFKYIYILLLLSWLISPYLALSQHHTMYIPSNEVICEITETFTTPGTTVWVCPQGVTSVFVKATGSGAAGMLSEYNVGGGGGGGGAYAEGVVQVTPGSSYPIYVGHGGIGEPDPWDIDDLDGEPSYFKSGADCYATGGSKGDGSTGTESKGGQGGQASGCVGDVIFSGGDGGDGSYTSATDISCAGSGGFAATISGDGVDGVNEYKCTTGSDQIYPGEAGTVYGEGGSGPYDNDDSDIAYGGDGKSGIVIICYSIENNLKDGLISCWEFDETSGTTAEDSHADNDGTNNGATVNQTGLINKAYDYSSNDYVTLPSVVWNEQADRSVSIWFKLDNITTDHALFSDWSTGAANSGQFLIQFDDVSGKTSATDVVAYILMTSDGATNGLWCETSVSFVAGTWYNVVITHDWGIGVNIYVNGVLSNNNYNQGDVITENRMTVRAGYAASNSKDMEGLIDQVATWNRVLTQEEVNKLYNNGAGLPYTNF